MIRFQLNQVKYSVIQLGWGVHCTFAVTVITGDYLVINDKIEVVIADIGNGLPPYGQSFYAWW